MNWSLAANVAATRVGADLVFLDLLTDEYSCLRSRAALDLTARQISASDVAAAQPLIEAGFLSLTPADGDCDERLPPAPPSHDLQVQPLHHIRGAELRDFLWCWFEALMRFPGRSLLALHKQVRDDRPAPPKSDLCGVGRRVAVFETLLPWAPFSGACLFRSYLLLRFLQRGGHDARWIIGVRTWPFEAHCWLQVSETALDDRCERLVRFRPLLAI